MPGLLFEQPTSYSVKELIEITVARYHLTFTERNSLKGYPSVEFVPTTQEDMDAWAINQLVYRDGQAVPLETKAYKSYNLLIDDVVVYTTIPAPFTPATATRMYNRIGCELVLCIGQAAELSYDRRMELIRICEQAIEIHGDLGDDRRGIPVEEQGKRFGIDADEWRPIPVRKAGIPAGYRLHARSKVTQRTDSLRRRDVPLSHEGAHNRDVWIVTEWSFYKETTLSAVSFYDRGPDINVKITTKTRYDGDHRTVQDDAVVEFLKNLDIITSAQAMNKMINGDDQA